jgi:tetratricopeptide (TPR) repeat protein
MVPQPAGMAPATAPGSPPGPDDIAPALSSIRPDSRIAQRMAGPSGIGGLLVIPIIGLFFTIFWNAGYLWRTLLPLFRSSAWATLTTPGTPEYHWLWQPLVLFETFAAVIMAIAPIALLAMILTRRRAARRYVISFYVFSCIAGAVDAGACLLIMVDWLRSLGLTETANALSSDSLRSLAAIFVLAVVWIPYFIRSRRVKNTLTNPPVSGQVDAAYFMAAGEAKATGRRRALGAAFAILGIIIVAGAAVFALNTFEASGAGQAPATPKSEATQFAQKAETAFAAGDPAQAVGFYSQAIQADRNYQTAYYGAWNVLVTQSNYAQALDLATEATKQFPDSRQAWFELGFAQEAQGALPDAVQSYTTCLRYPQDAANGGNLLDDAAVHKRLDLVTYVTGITDPRVAIADAIAQVNGALQATTPDAAALSSALTQADNTLSTNIALLQKVIPPAYFADFHSSMLTAYGAVKTACEALAAANSGADAASLSTARQSLNDAVDRFNENDKLGTSLMQGYYAQ